MMFYLRGFRFTHISSVYFAYVYAYIQRQHRLIQVLSITFMFVSNLGQGRPWQQLNEIDITLNWI